MINWLSAYFSPSKNKIAFVYLALGIVFPLVLGVFLFDKIDSQNLTLKTVMYFILLVSQYIITKYVDYVDRLYVAVPEELKLIANDCVPVDIGIVTVLNGNATIYRESKRLSPKFRHTTLTTLSLKLIRDYTE